MHMRINETLITYKKSLKIMNLNELKEERVKLKNAIKNHLGMLQQLTRVKINALNDEIKKRAS